VNLVRITGTAEVLGSLYDVEGLVAIRGSGRSAGDETAVTAYATDDAIGEVASRGAQVDIVRSESTDAARLQQIAQAAQQAASELGQA
jgi:hypothetical protein